jgi:hypothetical protein
MAFVTLLNLLFFRGDPKDSKVKKNATEGTSEGSNAQRN